MRSRLLVVPVVLQSALALAAAYLLGLLVAARSERRRPGAHSASARRGSGGPANAAPSRLVILVPAHDEEAVIGPSLAALQAVEYPDEARRLVVIADNCSDRTAAIAYEAGAEVWERHDEEQRGKGFALAWALERLLAEPDPFDGVVFVDADCLVSPNILGAVGGRFDSGARALQVDYRAANPGASSAAALRFAGFAVGDTVRFLGKSRLGLSCGLVGTGMAFRRELLAQVPWTTTGLVEDGEFHMRLVLAGEQVEFAAEASVSQAVPTSHRESSSQQQRWEQGKLELIRSWSGRLLASGLLQRDPQRLHAGLECLVPPQSLLALGNLAGAGAGIALRSRRLLALSLVSIGAQAAFVLGGLRLVGAPAYVYRALLSAPALILAKLGVYARLASGRGPSGWVRTSREASPEQAPSQEAVHPSGGPR
ncbi:MAG: glycosyltransferase family 2 protein [Solirubrobacterales bacterium]